MLKEDVQDYSQVQGAGQVGGGEGVGRGRGPGGRGRGAGGRGGGDRGRGGGPSTPQAWTRKGTPWGPTAAGGACPRSSCAPAALLSDRDSPLVVFKGT